MTNTRTAFLARRPFPLDEFQVKAIDAIDEGNSVLVAAPTGSGKTLVAEYAVSLALESGKKVFYTTPLKALSNQKYHDLVEEHGSHNVGLLTGDNVVNPDAPIVVMTTEVLRNMIYEQSDSLQGLRFVVLDEVHYLQNAYRGPVWEEVIIHASQDVRLVCLSATVSNAEELAAWITAVRGSTVAIIEEKRPVELNQHYMISVRGKNEPSLIPMFNSAGQPNPDGNNYDIRRSRFSKKESVKRPFSTPLRAEVIETLAHHNMLPAVYFIFSRNACDDAVRQCMNENIRLTTVEERELITEIAETATDHLSDEDLSALDYGSWVTALEMGLAAHHAGMVPPFKEAVEQCFAAGLVKVVFATETLALGINMPARTVVIEKLSKFTGERHEFLTPGEYTQLTGRAGRRGIDNIGHAVVLWSPWVDFNQISGLASARSYALSSSFRPTYNMAANLVSRYAPDIAHQLLNLSFAQYRADAEVVRLETSLQKLDLRIALLENNLQCDFGDVREAVKATREPTRTAASPIAVARSIGNLQVGDVIADPENDQFLIIISTSQRRSNDVRLGVITEQGRRFTLTTRDFIEVPHRVAKVHLPKPYNPKNRDFIKRAASDLRTVAPETTTTRPTRNNTSGATGSNAGASRCPDFEDHLKTLASLDKSQKERDHLETRVRSHAESLARQFDRVISLLRNMGYVDSWSLTDKGARLASIYHESDLLVAEVLERNVLKNLEPAELAAIVSLFTYETRGPAGTGPRVKLNTRGEELAAESAHAIWTELADAELAEGLPITRAPDPGFANLAHRWMKGHSLVALLDDEDMSGGDFVRNTKQLIDLMRQIAATAPDPEVRQTAKTCTETLFRGIVASTALEVDDAATNASAPTQPDTPSGHGN